MSFAVRNTNLDKSAIAELSTEPIFNASSLYSTTISSTLPSTTSGALLIYDGTNWSGGVANTLSIGNITVNGATNTISTTDTGGDLTLSAESTADVIITSQGNSFTWPNTTGAGGQILQTNGAGVLSWTSASGVGDVTASTVFGTDNVIIRSDGTSKGVQSTGISISDTDVLSGITQLNIDNLRLDGNVLSSTNTDGDITITPNGTGSVNLHSVAVSSGNVISGASQLNLENLRIDGNTFSSTSGDLLLSSSTGLFGIDKTSPVSTLHIYENTSSTTTSTGVTIEQDGVGDAVCQFLLTSGQRWVMGIDNSDSDKFKIASDTDLNTNARFTIETDGDVGIGIESPSAKLHIVQANAADALRVDDEASDTTYFSINQSGLCGINTGSPVEELTINGNISIPTDNKFIGFNIYNNGVWRLGTAGFGGFLRFETDGKMKYYNFSSSGSSGADAGTALERFTIQQDGTVGIGITGPTSTLHVSGDFQVDNLNMNGNTLISTDTDGDVTITPNGTGSVNLHSVAVSSTSVVSGVTQLNVDNLRLDGNILSSTDSGGDINITPDTTGNVILDGQTWPNALGLNGQVLQTDASGNLSWTTLAGSGDVTAASNFGTDELMIIADGTGKGVQSVNLSVVQTGSDTVLTNTSSGGDLTVAANATGDLKLTSQGVTYTLPTTDGSNGFVLQTNGAGAMSWVSAAGGGDVSASSTFGTDELMIIADGTGKNVQSVNLSVVQTASDTVITNTSSGGDLTIAANATGDLKFTSKGVTYIMPTADGSSGYVLQTNGSGTLTWASAAGVGDVTASSSFGTDNAMIIADGTGKGVQSVNLTVTQSGVDTTIANTSTDGNITLTPNGSGNLILDGQTWPNALGSEDQILSTDASGNLTWITNTGTGDVLALTSFSADNRLIRSHGTSKTIQDSGITISDTDAISGITQLDVDNLMLNGNTLSSTDTGGDINITPDTTGSVNIHSVSISSADVVSGITQLNVDNLRLDGNTLSSTSGDILLSSSTQLIGVNHSTPVSKLHVYENTTAVGTDAGLTIEQDGTGDAVCQFLLTGGQRWVVGIDNSDSDKFKIASDTNLNTNAHFTIETNGEVGIGTESPSALLHVQQTGSSDCFRVDDQSSDSTYFSIDASGNIGVLTDNPVESLTVNGDICLQNDDRFLGFNIYNNGLWRFADAGFASFIKQETDGKLNIYNFNDTIAGVADADAGTALARITLKQDGTVGIGNSNPTSTLDVSGDLQIDNLNMNGNTIASTDTNGDIILNPNGTGKTGINVSSPDSQLDVDGSQASGTSLRLRSGSSTTFPGPSNQIAFSFNGGALYSHSMRTRHSSGSTADNAIDFFVWDQTTDASGDVGTKHCMSMEHGNIGIGTEHPSAKLHVIQTDASDCFRVDDQASDTTYFSIDASGNVGIGKTTPSSTLDVTGDFQIDNLNMNGNSLISTDTNGDILLTPNGTGKVGIQVASPDSYLDVDGDQSTGTSLRLRGGDTTTTPGTSSQIAFSFDGGALYSHNIRSRHNAGATADNAIDFYVWDQTTDASGDLGTKHCMTMEHGQVGIGTNSPSSTLDVLGDFQIDNLNMNGNSLISTDTNGDILITPDGTGKVGIQVASPDSHLDVDGDQASGTSLRLRSGSSTTFPGPSNQIAFSFNGGALYSHSMRTRHSSGSTADNAIDFFVWDQTTDASGDVGTKHCMSMEHGNIGIGTEHPSAKLHVIQTDASDCFRVDDQAGDSSYFNIDASGNVGVGIATPSSYLDVNGDQSTGTSLRLRGGDTTTTPGTSSQIAFSFDGGALYSHNVRSRHNAGGTTGNAIDFYVWDQTGDASGDIGTKHCMTMEHGNVGIGIENPSAELHVVGKTYQQGGQQIKRTTVSDAGYTVLSTDYLVVYTSITTSRTVTLPAASTVSGQKFVIKDESGLLTDSICIILDGNSAETIDDNLTISLDTPFQSITIYSDGSNWFTISEDTAEENTVLDATHYTFARQLTKIQGSNTLDFDTFGTSVSISGNGKWAIVGAPQNDAGGTSAGSIYFFKKEGETWEESVTITGSAVNDNFGNSVHMSRCGKYAIVTAPSNDTTASDAGIVYIYKRNGDTWSLQASLQSDDIQASDEFGKAVAISDNGTHCAVGVPLEDTSGSGAGSVYIFSRSGTTWTQQQKIQASDPQTDDRFGQNLSLSADGKYLAVGAPYEDTTASNAGSVYVFSRSGTTWTQQQKLQASDAGADDEFGISVTISRHGEYLAIGAHKENTTASDAGSVYIFTRSGSSSSPWSEQQKIQSKGLQSSDNFGQSLSISDNGELLIIGSPDNASPGADSGAAYIFKRSGSEWFEQQQLKSSDASNDDDFGTRVEISGNGKYYIVGAKIQDTTGVDAGSVYIFSQDMFDETSISPYPETQSLYFNTPRELQKLQAANVEANDNFGINVAISGNGDYVVVSSYLEDTTASDAGSVYILKREGANWVPQQQLQASNAGSGDQFGIHVDISDDGKYIAIGARFEDTTASNSGAVYIFKYMNYTWVEQQIIKASDPEADDNFGSSLSLSGNGQYLIVGSLLEDTTASNAGSAYIYKRFGSTWVELQKLQASNAGSGDQFGYSVSISFDGSYCVVGAPYEDTGATDSGSVYVFIRNGTIWTEQQKMSGVDVPLYNGFSNLSLYGASVSISGDSTYIIVGSPQFLTTNLGGAAFVYVRSGTTWALQQELLSLTVGVTNSDRFGSSVDISHNGYFLIIGDPKDNTNSGFVEIWKRSGTTWTRKPTLQASDITDWDEFGYSVAISSDGLYSIIGAPYEDTTASNAGQVYMTITDT